MISFLVGSDHYSYEIPNEYLSGWRNLSGKIISIKCFFFFFSNGHFPSRIFSDSYQYIFIFGEATSPHFFIVTTSRQQLLFRSGYFFWAAAFFRCSFFRTVTSQYLFFQNSYFFQGEQPPLQSSHFLRIGSS